MKNLLVAQSGGPSVAINATLAGVVEKAMTHQNVGKIDGVWQSSCRVSGSARHHPLRLAPAA